MPRLNANADAYAAARLNIFFPGFPSSLTGQCVSLNKWFLAEMTEVPNPQAARGHAKDYGDSLVAQGHAFVVPAGERKPGDFVVWKQDGGGYGHIGVLLTGDRVFEENVGIAGSTRGVFEGNVVYASRIDPLYQNWRVGAPTFYRIKTYSEQGDEMPIPNADNYYGRYNKAMAYIRGREMSREEFNKNFVGNTDLRMLEAMLDDAEAEAQVNYASLGRRVTAENWSQQLTDLRTELAKKPTEVIKEVPVEIIKEVPVEVIKEVVKGDADRSLGDLLLAAFNKLFKIK